MVVRFLAVLELHREGQVELTQARVLLFAFEAAVAPSLQHVMTVTKVAAFSLGVAGAVAALAVLVSPVRRWATR